MLAFIVHLVRLPTSMILSGIIDLQNFFRIPTSMIYSGIIDPQKFFRNPFMCTGYADSDTLGWIFFIYEMDVTFNS